MYYFCCLYCSFYTFLRSLRWLRWPSIFRFICEPISQKEKEKENVHRSTTLEKNQNYNFRTRDLYLYFNNEQKYFIDLKGTFHKGPYYIEISPYGNLWQPVLLTSPQEVFPCKPVKNQFCCRLIRTKYPPLCEEGNQSYFEILRYSKCSNIVE